MGITSADNQKKLIIDAIEAEVYDLLHADPDVKQHQGTAKGPSTEQTVPGVTV